MDNAPRTLAEQFAAATEWWIEAGVDCEFGAAPTNWLDRPAPPPQEAPAAAPAKPAEPAIPPLGGPAASWPTALADFARWWLTNDDLETGGTAPRVPPRGVAGAELMVLLPMPEAEDRDRVFSGPQGKFLDNMLAAMRISDEAVYFAAALPRHASHPDWQALARRDLGKVLVHHINLVAPMRLLILGRAVLPLFGHDPAQHGAKPRQIELQGSTVPTLVSFSPDTLLEMRQYRAGLWRGWLDWTGGNE